MRRLAPLLPALAVTALLSACATNQNMTLAPAVAPTVATSDYPILLSAGPAGLASGEAARLGGWLEAMRAGPGDRLEVPPGLAAREIVPVVAGFGLKMMPAPAIPSDDGVVRVTLHRATASVADCPNWSDEQLSTSAGSTSRNFGCATTGNLAAMLADPGDLVHGKSDTASDPRVSLRAIQMWRDSKPSGAGGLKTESVGGGK